MDRGVWCSTVLGVAESDCKYYYLYRTVEKMRLRKVSCSLKDSQLAETRMGCSNSPLSACTAQVLKGPHACHEPWETSHVIQLQSHRHHTWNRRCVQEALGC